MAERSERAEVVVVGSGAGGGIAAMLLAEAGLDVLLLEEGPDLPLDSAPHFSRAEIIQKYRNAGVEVTMAGTKVAWVEGCCVGGGTEVNRGLYCRTPDEVLGSWRREFRVEGLTAEEMRAHFEAVEAIVPIARLPGPPPETSRRLTEGAAALGWRSEEVARLVRYPEDWASGASARHQSMTETAIPRFRRAGGRLLAGSRVRRLWRQGGRWRVSVESGPGDTRRRFEIETRSVFVAGGAVQTPLLLRRSGVRRNVGDSLHFHPMIKVVARFPGEVNGPGGLDPVHQVKEFEPRFSMGCSVSRRPALALALADRPELLPEVDRDWRHLAIYYVQTTGGPATVRGIPGFRDPLVRVAPDPRLGEKLAEGLCRLAECLFVAGAEAVYPAAANLPLLEAERDLPRIPERLPESSGSVTAMHLFSSCPMGEDRARAATDSFGRVHGAEGLYVADASLLCGPTLVNPQGTVMAVAHRNVQRFLEMRAARRERSAGPGATREVA